MTARKTKPNPPLFGSKERIQQYGRHEGQTSRSGAKADRSKTRRAGYAKALGKKATATREEELRPYFEKAEREENTAFARVLGSSGRAHAVKISPGDGGTFGRRDLVALEASGWAVWPGRTAPAILGKGLGAFQSEMGLNPTDRITRALGSSGRTRAVVIGASGINKETVNDLRRAGYDVSAAPKEFRDGTIKANPSKTGQGRTAPDTGRAGVRQSSAMQTSPRARAAATKGLARVWKMWTGTEPTKEMRLRLDKIGKTVLPAAVVLLGQVVSLVGTDGTAKEWSGKRGPFLVTDARAKCAWLLSEKPESFSMNVAVISYVATKAKFGDKAPAEYVHDFTRPASARMDGQTGTLKGSFTLTPRGIEG